MTAIRDPVHGYIELDDLALALIDTPQMQRLRWIKQLGLANLVYPGANHTRFEHSLGAYHLARGLADHLGLAEEEKLSWGQRPCCTTWATVPSPMPQRQSWHPS